MANEDSCKTPSDLSDAGGFGGHLFKLEQDIFRIKRYQIIFMGISSKKLICRAHLPLSC